MPERIEVNVYLEDSQLVKELKQKLFEAEKRAFRMSEMYTALEVKYSNVQMVNLELIDTLKAHGFKSRPGADVRNWTRDG